MVVMSRLNASIDNIRDLGTKNLWQKEYIYDMPLKHEVHSNKVFWKGCFDYLCSQFDELNPDEVVVGNLADNNIYPFLLKKRKKIQQITVLDDGTPTLEIARSLQQGFFRKTYHVKSVKNILKYISFFNLWLPLISIPRKLTFYTLFNIELRPEDTLIPNKYNWVRRRVKEKETTRELLFIGSHIVDRNLVSEADYYDSLKIVSDIAQKEGLDFVYVHHRGESEKIRNYIQENYKTREFSLPLELAYLDESRPICFAGHFSTALFSLSRIYDVEMRAYLFPDSKIIGSQHESASYIRYLQNVIERDSYIHSSRLTN